MDNLSINQVMFKNPVTRKYFLGTFPADRIPRVNKFPASFVVNMDNSDKLGSHWVAMYIPSRNTIYYYDSFGIKPSNPNIRRYLRRFKHPFENKITFQSLITDICGYYVMYFIYMSSRNHNVFSISKILCRQRNPDLFVWRFVKNHIL